MYRCYFISIIVHIILYRYAKTLPKPMLHIINIQVCVVNMYDRTPVITKQQSWARGCSKRCCQFAPHRTGLVGIAHAEILRNPVPTRPLQPAKRAHYRGRGRVVAVTPLAETSYAIGMVIDVCVCWRIRASCVRTKTLKSETAKFFFWFSNGFRPTTTVNKQDCCLLQWFVCRSSSVNEIQNSYVYS